MTYDFELIIDRDATDMPFVDLIFEALQGAAVPAGGNGKATVFFTLEAKTLAAAIAKGVHVLEGMGLAVLGVESLDLVSMKDIADRTGRTYESVRLLATGKRGPGGFPVPESAGQWALYSWTLVSDWFAEHFGGEAVGVFDREIAAADYLLRARRILGDDANRAEFARLVAA